MFRYVRSLSDFLEDMYREHSELIPIYTWAVSNTIRGLGGQHELSKLRPLLTNFTLLLLLSL